MSRYLSGGLTDEYFRALSQTTKNVPQKFSSRISKLFSQFFNINFVKKYTYTDYLERHIAAEFF